MKLVTSNRSPRRTQRIRIDLTFTPEKAAISQIWSTNGPEMAAEGLLGCHLVFRLWADHGKKKLLC